MVTNPTQAVGTLRNSTSHVDAAMSTLQRNLYEALSESVYMIQGFFDRTQESAVQLQKTVQDTDVMGLSSVYQTLTTNLPIAY